MHKHDAVDEIRGKIPKISFNCMLNSRITDFLGRFLWRRDTVIRIQLVQQDFSFTVFVADLTN